jgi:hypothetical protein
MNPPAKPASSQTSLFQVYLRLRPPITKEEAANAQRCERYLNVEPADTQNESQPHSDHPTHITLQPPNDSRKRAVEKFAFTRVFEEDSRQLELFENTGMASLIDGVLNEGRDGLVATLGVTGSGKVRFEKKSPLQLSILTAAIESHYSWIQEPARRNTNVS